MHFFEWFSILAYQQIQPVKNEIYNLITVYYHTLNNIASKKNIIWTFYWQYFNSLTLHISRRLLIHQRGYQKKYPNHLHHRLHGVLYDLLSWIIPPLYYSFNIYFFLRKTVLLNFYVNLEISLCNMIELVLIWLYYIMSGLSSIFSVICIFPHNLLEYLWAICYNYDISYSKRIYGRGKNVWYNKNTSNSWFYC